MRNVIFTLQANDLLFATGRMTLLASIALLNVACGGSGGGDAPPITPIVTPPAPPAPATPSVFAVTSPSNNTYVNASMANSLRVTGVCDNSASSINVSGAVTASTSCSNGQWSLQLNLASVADGTINISVAEIVTSGTVPASVAIAMTKDTVSPSVTFQSPAMNASIAPVNTAALLIRGTCSENNVVVSLGGAVTGSATCSNGAWSTNIDISNAAAGNLTIDAQQVDVAGNSTKQSLSVIKATACTTAQLTQLASDIVTTLTTTSTDADFSFDVKTEEGRELTYNRGVSTMTTPYQSASTSKWVSATIILLFMESSANLNSSQPLTLNSRPQDFLDSTTWPISSSDSLSSITLRQLLSFTSGLIDEPTCITPGLPGMSFSACVATVASTNAGNGKIPGAEFYYSGSHLQVAGMMAIAARNRALGIGTSTWQDLFSDFKTKTGLFANSQYNLPSTTNPRLAGGMTWLGSDYLQFIEAVYKKQVLSSNAVAGQLLSYRQQQLTDQLANATIGNSPVLQGIGEDWHYGFGLWQECHAATYNCTNGVDSYSSPGAYGAYPFMNLGNKFYGIIARQGALGTFRNGYALYSTVQPKVIQWANRSCP